MGPLPFAVSCSRQRVDVAITKEVQLIVLINVVSRDNIRMVQCGNGIRLLAVKPTSGEGSLTAVGSTLTAHTPAAHQVVLAQADAAHTAGVEALGCTQYLPMVKRFHLP